MIILHDEKLVVLTAPRTGSLHLHEALCARRNAYWVVGTQNGHTSSRHIATIPNEFRHYRRALIVRHPYQRLLGLYDEYNRQRSQARKKPLSLLEYVHQRHAFGWRHSWSIAKWADETVFDFTFRLEKIRSDLRDVFQRVPTIKAATTERDDWRSVFSQLPDADLANLYSDLIEDSLFGYAHDVMRPNVAPIYKCL